MRTVAVGDALYKTVIAAARAAKAASYSPYSKFRVGAALRTKTGEIIVGTNVENSSYGLTICAERSAIVSAVSQGHKEFDAIAVTTDMEEHCSPCGACRQFISEFGNIPVILVANTSDVAHVYDANELLPLGFNKEQLDSVPSRKGGDAAAAASSGTSGKSQH